MNWANTRSSPWSEGQKPYSPPLFLPPVAKNPTGGYKPPLPDPLMAFPGASLAVTVILAPKGLRSTPFDLQIISATIWIFEKVLF